MNRLRISIAMTSYNGARFIRQQLESFTTQNRLPDELVICDDRSSDETVEIVERFAASAPFHVRLYRNPVNLGFNANFAQAMSLAEGDLICISDQDDIWYPEKLERVVQYVEDHPTTLALLHDEHIADRDGSLYDGTMLSRIREVGYPDSYFVGGNCTVIRKELIPIILPLPDGEPYDCWIVAIIEQLGIRHLLDMPLQLYRRHDDNVSNPELLYRRPSLWSIFAQYGLKDARPGWARQVTLLTDLLGRIERHSLLIDACAGPGTAVAAVQRIQAAIPPLHERAALLGIPRWRRIPRIASLLRRGFYANFSGLKSAVKDVVRP